MGWVSPTTKTTGTIITDTEWNQSVCANSLYLYGLIAGVYADRQTTTVSVTAAKPFVAITGGTGCTITLPSAWAIAVGTLVVIKDEWGVGATYTITIVGQAGETVDGAASGKINTAYGLIALYSDGAAWHVAWTYGG